MLSNERKRTFVLILDATPNLKMTLCFLCPGMQNAVRSGMGLLGMHPSASLPHPLHQPGLSGPRMPGLLPLDVRPNLLQPGNAARFPLLMQPGPVQQAPGISDGSLRAPARPRVPFTPMDPFNRIPNLTNESLPKAETESSSGADEGKDQDYRFPPVEKQSTGLLRTPPPDHREPLGGGGQGGGGRPPLLQTPGSQLARSSLAGRLQALAGFTPDSRWNQTRGDFDERDGIQGGPQTPGGPKGFQDERSTPGQNFPNRFDGRSGTAGGTGGAVGAPPPWNRSGGPTAPFDSEHQDLDDRRRPWERQRDRDERDFDFRREMNGNRLSRERDREHDRDRDRGRERTREHERDKEREGDRERERGGWTPLLPLPTPLLPTPPINPNLTLNQGKPLTPLKINPPNMQRFQSPLVSQAQAKPPLLSLNQPPPQVQIKSLPPPAQNQAAVSMPQSESPALVETPVGQSAPVTHSPKPSSDEKDQSPLPERPPQSESSPQPETLPPSESPPHLPSKTSASPDNETISQASPLLPLSSQDSPGTLAAAESPRESPTRFLKKQESPQNDEDSSHTQRVNGPERCSASVAEPTSNAPHASDCLLPESESKPQQVQASPPKDPNNEQSEPLEEAPSQPVVDSVTDTEGT